MSQPQCKADQYQRIIFMVTLCSRKMNCWIKIIKAYFILLEITSICRMKNRYLWPNILQFFPQKKQISWYDSQWFCVSWSGGGRKGRERSYIPGNKNFLPPICIHDSIHFNIWKKRLLYSHEFCESLKLLTGTICFDSSVNSERQTYHWYVSTAFNWVTRGMHLFQCKWLFKRNAIYFYHFT